MTVRKLIELLEKQDKDAIVEVATFCCNSTTGLSPTIDVHARSDFIVVKEGARVRVAVAR